MAYETEKDVLIEDLGGIANTDLHAEVRAYDGGTKKLCVYRLVGKAKKRVQVFRLPIKDITQLGEFLVDFTATHGTGEEEPSDEASE